jgi:hypothetical protein
VSPLKVPTHQSPGQAIGFCFKDFGRHQSGDHPENNLAKFGNILQMKVELKINKSFYILG